MTAAGPRVGALSGRMLRLRFDRATMAHLASVYPFHADTGLGQRGPYLGVDVTAGMGAFHFDPFELYAAGHLTNPNCLVMGEVGTGKSATVKAFLRRSLAVYGTRRFVAVLDPKGEYRPFADAHGLAVLRLRPGGTDRLNPMDGRPGDTAHSVVAAVLGRALDPVEDALLGWAVAALARTGRPFTLGDIAPAVANPSTDLSEVTRRSAGQLTDAATPVLLALDKLCNRTLAGMFDGPSTVDVDWAAGPGIVIDLSAVYGDDEALPLVMLAATSWLAAVLRNAGNRRVVQVVDESWVAVRHGARHFQASLKLARAYGASTWLVCHRPADLTAQSDDGTTDAKVAAGLLADIGTRITLRQTPDQLVAARNLLGLGAREAATVGQLVRGRALWKLQGHAAVVHTVLTETERRLFGTDAAMSANPSGFGGSGAEISGTEGWVA
jgi:type IV secretory pathway VirB4 component